MTTPSGTPTRYGIALFPGFQALDAFGPLDALNILSDQTQISLSILAETLEPVSTRITHAEGNQKHSSFEQRVVPTHTFDSAPPLDVLIVPGGIGTHGLTDTRSIVDFLARVYPSLQYLITVCTGARLIARAGILDGRRATTNKAHFSETVGHYPKVDWVWHARWVVDGNTWTASGVTAGIDLTMAFIEKVYDRAMATKIANTMEYDRHEDPSWDKFAEILDKERK